MSRHKVYSHCHRHIDNTPITFYHLQHSFKSAGVWACKNNVLVSLPPLNTRMWAGCKWVWTDKRVRASARVEVSVRVSMGMTQDWIQMYKWVRVGIRVQTDVRVHGGTRRMSFHPHSLWVQQFQTNYITAGKVRVSHHLLVSPPLKLHTCKSKVMFIYPQHLPKATTKVTLWATNSNPKFSWPIIYTMKIFWLLHYHVSQREFQFFGMQPELVLLIN